MNKIFSTIISSPLTGRLCGLLFALLSTTTLWAYDFESGGFDYTITSNSKPYTVAVSGYYKTYSGHMQIPSSVVHNGITYSVTSIKDDAFNSEKCQNLTSVTIPNSVITIGWSAFLGCESLVSVNIGDNVEVIDMFAFAACHSLTSICIPDNVKTIKDRAFTECASLKSLTIGKSVTQIGNLSFSQNSLETITCKAIQVPSITSTTFSYVPCSSATLYVLPSLLDQYKTTNGWNKFGNILPIDGIVEDTYSITVTCNPEEGTVSGGGVYQAGATATLTATPKDGYEFVRWSDGNTANPRTLTVTADLTLTAEFAIIEDDDVIDSGTCGENLTWTLTYNGVLTISGTGDMKDYSQWNGKKDIIKNVIVMYGVTSIGVDAFSECSSLTSITIPNSVTSIGDHAFHCCKSLTSITIPNSVTSIGNYAFCVCSSLTSVTIPNSVTSIGDEAFFGTGIYNNESNWENDVLYISNCLIEAKTKISGSYTIKDNTRLLAARAFDSCSSLTSITIPNSVTSIIGGYAFSGCSSLTSITIPNSVTSIGIAAFYNCSSLTSITIPNSVTSIGNWTFDGCSSLTSLTIPNSVTSIGYDAFCDCSSLTTVICKAIELPKLKSHVFADMPLSEATLYVPAESLDDYKAADQWKDFGRILPLEEAPSAVENTRLPIANGAKLLRDGQLLIIRDGKTYTITGQKL